MFDLVEIDHDNNCTSFVPKRKDVLFVNSLDDLEVETIFAVRR